MGKRRMVAAISAENDAADKRKAVVLQLFLTHCARPHDSFYALFCPKQKHPLAYVCSTEGALDNVSYPASLSAPPGQPIQKSNVHALPPGTSLHHWIPGLPPEGAALWCPIAIANKAPGINEAPGLLVLWWQGSMSRLDVAAGQLSEASASVATLLQSWPDDQDRCRKLQLLLNSLEELCAEVTSQEDLREILLKTCMAVARCLGFAEIQVYVFNADRSALRGMWSVNAEGSQQDLSESQLPMHHSTEPLAQVARGEIARWVSAAVADDQTPTAILPLRSGGETVGIMRVCNNSQNGTITEEQLQGLLPFVAQAATTVHAAIIRDRLRVESQRANAIDASRKSFERDMIHSVTDGKMNLCDSGEIQDRLGERVLTLSVKNPSDVSECRQALSKAAFKVGMTAERKGDFDLCVGEAATNCVQHGGGGHLELYQAGPRLQVRVCDDGPGITSSLLPRATLLSGYSTKTSLGVGFSVILNLCDHLYLSTSEGGTDILVEMSMERKSEAELLWDQLDMRLDALS